MYPHPTLARGLPVPPCDPEVGLDGNADLAAELATYLDLPCEVVAQGFTEAEARLLVDHHRRKRASGQAVHALAEALGVTDAVIRRACVGDGAREILAAIAQATRSASPTFLAWLPETGVHTPHHD